MNSGDSFETRREAVDGPTDDSRRRPLAGGNPFVVLALFGLYVLAGKVGLSVAFTHANASALWPPAGIALAAFLGLGYRCWPAVFAGAFVVNITTAGSVATALAIAGGNTAEGLLGAWLVNRFANGVKAFDRAQDVFKFAGLAAVLSTTVSATTGVASLAFGEHAAWADFGRIWLTWWLGDATGVMIFAPLLVLWMRNWRPDGLGRRRLEAVALFVSTVLAGLAAFGDSRLAVFGLETPPLTFLSAPPLIWAALRFRPREVATLMAGLSGIAIWQTLHGSRPFVGATVSESLLLLQAFMGTVSLMALAAAALVEERRTVEQEREDLLVREQAARAQAEDTNRAKDEFLAIFGHELRTPLATIISAVSVLDRIGTADDTAVRARGAIRHQISHLSRLVDDLLDVTRVTGGTIVLTCQPVSLATSVQRLVRALAGTGRLERHVLDVQAEPVWVNADPVRLEEIVSNLLSNAIKYTSPGGRIRLHVRSESDDAVVSITDTGIGIPPTLLPRIFDPCGPGQRGLDRVTVGPGVGLALVRRLVDLHGGRVEVFSDGPGRGSEFVVRLPRIAPGPEEPEPVVITGAPQRNRILIVEDNVDACQMLRLALELAGHEVDVAGDGRQALDLAAARSPEIVLVDIGLPGMDGYEVARRLRTTPQGRQMRLLAVTGYGDAENRQRSLEAGFDAHLVKPVDPEALTRMIGTVAAAPGQSPADSQGYTIQASVSSA